MVLKIAWYNPNPPLRCIQRAGYVLDMIALLLHLDKVALYVFMFNPQSQRNCFGSKGGSRRFESVNDKDSTRENVGNRIQGISVGHLSLQSYIDSRSGTILGPSSLRITGTCFVTQTMQRNFAV
jgi:hypothetical protein